MTTVKKVSASALKVGRMFCIPLADDAGFGFGYVALTRKGWGSLFNVFDHIAPTDTPPDDIESRPLIIHNLLGGGADFLAAPANPVPWRLLDRYVAAPEPVEQALFQIGSKIKDMVTDDVVDDPTIDRTALPFKEYPLDSRYRYMVTAKLLRCDFRFDKEKRAYELLR